MTWQPIETAPQGHWETTTNAAGAEYIRHVPVRIICANKVWATESYWIPPENRTTSENGRWHNFSEEHPPTHWQHFEELPS